MLSHGSEEAHPGAFAGAPENRIGGEAISDFTVRALQEEGLLRGGLLQPDRAVG